MLLPVSKRPSYQRRDGTDMIEDIQQDADDKYNIELWGSYVKTLASECAHLKTPSGTSKSTSKSMFSFCLCEFESVSSF